jgi:hypothetical protein
MEHARGDKMDIKCWLENLKEGDQHLGIDRRIILKWMLKGEVGEYGPVSFGSE